MTSTFKHRNLPLLMLQARERIIGYFRPLLHDNGLTEQQWRIVRALNDTGPLEPRQIGDLCRLSSPSLAGVLERMDDLGLVARKRFPHDQRRVLVSLTARSRALATRLAPRIDAIYDEIEGLLGSKSCGQLYAVLDTLLEKLQVSGSKPE